MLSCSSCIALFRQCSLAERAKRQACCFETAAPVIGQLHGVTEEGGPESVLLLPPPPPPLPPSQPTGKRSNSRTVWRTQVLRDWFAANVDHPYPTDGDKTALAERSGLSRTQVIN